MRLLLVWLINAVALRDEAQSKREQIVQLLPQLLDGRDGGVLREVLKHPSIEKAMLCEIDRTVVDTALKYYPEIPGNTFDDERTVVVIADGRKFVAETDERFDAIIVRALMTDPQHRYQSMGDMRRVIEAAIAFKAP